MPIDPDELIPSDEAARLLGLKVHTLTSWRHEGKGPTYLKIGRSIFYRRDDIRAWLGTCIREPANSGKAA